MEDMTITLKAVQNLRDGVTTVSATFAMPNLFPFGGYNYVYYELKDIVLKINGNQKVKTDGKIIYDDSQGVYARKSFTVSTTVATAGSYSVEVSHRYRNGLLNKTDTFTETFTVPQWSSLPPSASVSSVTADRYGENAVASLSFGHSRFATEAVFTLSGLTPEQAEGRRASADSVTADSVSYNLETETTYSGTLSLDGSVPLTSGKVYPWSFTVTAQNGEVTQLNGVLRVPQKVTGISAPTSANVRVGGSTQLNYSIYPADAELRTITASTSAPTVATVTSSGVVNGISEGTATITLTTVDGSFSADVAVAVIDTDSFPVFPDELEYCSAPLLNDIQQAANFLNLNLDLGLTLDVFTATTDINPRLLKGLIEGILANVAAVCTEAKTEGKAPSEVTDDDIAEISAPLPKENNGTLANALNSAVRCMVLINDFN